MNPSIHASGIVVAKELMGAPSRNLLAQRLACQRGPYRSNGCLLGITIGWPSQAGGPRWALE